MRYGDIWRIMRRSFLILSSHEPIGEMDAWSECAIFRAGVHAKYAVRGLLLLHRRLSWPSPPTCRHRPEPRRVLAHARGMGRSPSRTGGDVGTVGGEGGQRVSGPLAQAGAVQPAAAKSQLVSEQESTRRFCN